MSDKLQEIVNQVKRDYQKKGPLKPEIEKEIAKNSPETRDFETAISKTGQNKTGQINIIAEIKRKSPSAGNLRPDLIPEKLAVEYEKAGACAISVLTNEGYFGGKMEDLRSVYDHVKIPLLCKEFIVNRRQIFEARKNGASAILLIVAALNDTEITEFRKTASDLGMSSLIEVHNESELNRALKLNAKIIGINNRDLKTLTINLSTTLELAPKVPNNVILIAESGYKNAEEVKDLKKTNVKAVLVGESLLRDKNPSKALQIIIQGA